jgi:hypothetical protein
MLAVANAFESHHTPQKTEPRESRGLQKFGSEFHREYLVHWVKLIAKKVAIIATA